MYIGEIRVIYSPYFDTNTKSQMVKKRPAIILAKADEDDYVFIP